MLAQKVEIPASFEILFSCPLYQMVCMHPAAALKNDIPIRPLGAKDIPQMLELTGKTKPGPFFAQTYTMGDYYGIFQHEKLVSMAGERLQLPGYTEVSAICTDPEYLGNGYALLLTSFLAHKIQHEGNIPFLHVKTDNSRAIDVYKRAGFEIRKEIFFAIFRKKF
jgi:predicted GNAT family acetyltransferase